VNGDGLLNSDNILRKSSTVEDVKDISIIKVSNMDKISTKEEMLPPRSLPGKGPTSEGRKNDEAMKKKIADASLKVCNAYVKEESDVEKFNPISSSGAKHGEGSNFGWEQRSPMSSSPSQALFESSSKYVGTEKLGSSRGLVSLSKKVYPRVKEKDGYHILSDANTTIHTIFKRSQPRPPPREGGLLQGKQLQALTKIKREPIGGPKSGRTGPVGVPQHKRKRPIQPFACSPLNTKDRPKTPLNRRLKWAKYGSIHERVGGICTRDYSSDNEKEESDSPDGSSRAEVKGNVDYTIGD
jgi:hypothetical protein